FEELVQVGSSRAAAMSMLLQLFDIGACYKGPPRANDDNSSYSLIALRLVNGNRDSFRHSGRKRIDRRSVNRYYPHTACYRSSNQLSHVWLIRGSAVLNVKCEMACCAMFNELDPTS